MSRYHLQAYTADSHDSPDLESVIPSNVRSLEHARLYVRGWIADRQLTHEDPIIGAFLTLHRNVSKRAIIAPIGSWHVRANPALNTLRRVVSGRVMRGEAVAITEQR